MDLCIFFSHTSTDFAVDLSLGPICLGRGPAFRKRNVEKAIRLATLDG